MEASKRPVALILSCGETATTDYIILPHLESQGYQVTLLNCSAEPFESAFDVNSCRLVVISRYWPGCWLEVLERLRRQGTKLVYFMDDDLFDIRALRGLPLRYQWKIVTQSLMHRPGLLRMCDEFWVSTAHLAEKYSKFDPVLLGPMPAQKTMAEKDGIHVCYHGTASHRREIEWIAPIIEAVQAGTDKVHFELFGTREVNRRFCKLPRVSVLHPMSWPNYLAFTTTQKRDIALSPLLGGAFNAARGPTKFFDYTRMGAVGLYSDVSPYRGLVRDGVDGVLLDNDPAVWVETILTLAQDERKRASIAAAARQRVLDVINIRQQ